ncbi:MAG TPA: cytochrome-c peroxidase [Cryomorphaceae bacterium]|nr:cytochrome-c peroxidase [Owenweeksia sp.]HBF21243.1 cytochrome-c peroxidase [Cryomorphaceae bacterium]HCQ15599.1 cytochrome-c peroxidase [Cryomorphaceae bacterium]|tara:strand:- start:7096 stop:8223 length:1128 start_codon:yes stop_codon:yes gene_type:complete
MKNKKLPFLLALFSITLVLSQCKKDQSIIVKDEDPGPEWPGATPYILQIPEGFPPNPNIPADNPMTVEGVKLGRFLFYDKRLSKDLSMSCGSCHLQRNAFSDKEIRSIGIHGEQTRRHSMALFNLAWQEHFFWDGRAMSLEEQALQPVTDKIELDNDWETVVARLETDSVYPEMFKAAFGPGPISKENAAKAIAQFERSIVSANSEFDQVVRLQTKADFNDPGASRAWNFFNSDIGGDCFHCHGVGETSFLMGAFGNDLQFSNNGLDDVADQLEDKGYEEVSGDPNDRAKFKIGSLRNIFFSSPYMHDGSIPNLDSLVEFYNFGGHVTPTTDPNMKAAGKGRQWTREQKDDLKRFFETLTDYEYLQNPDYADPFE